MFRKTRKELLDDLSKRTPKGKTKIKPVEVSFFVLGERVRETFEFIEPLVFHLRMQNPKTIREIKESTPSLIITGLGSSLTVKEAKNEAN